MFYEKLLELCKLRGVTPTEVTRQIGVNKSNVTYWKNGSIPKATTMNKIANYFGCTVEYLLGDVPEPDGKLVFADEIETPDPKREDRIDRELEGIDFALYGEVKDLTNEQKQDVLDFIRFKKSQDQNRGK